MLGGCDLMKLAQKAALLFGFVFVHCGFVVPSLFTGALLNSEQALHQNISTICPPICHQTDPWIQWSDATRSMSFGTPVGCR